MGELMLVKHFEEVVELIQSARTKALQSVNRELIDLYWQVGEYISRKVESSEWGDKTVQQLADYIKSNYVELKGFSRRGLYRMRQFYETYRDHPIVSPLVTQLSWTNNLIILSRCKSFEKKEFYIRLSMKENYSKRALERQINAGVFERTMLANKKLSATMRAFPQDTGHVFRDSYVFEFLDLPREHLEKDLRKALIEHFRDFILELGGDFTLVGEEFRLQVGHTDFAVDLLFYHRELRCLIAFELKMDKVRPEHLGKLEFYLEALDRDVRKPYENLSMGVLLCKDKDDEVVEYALSRSMSPAVVADYETKLIPKKLLRQKLHEFFELATGEKGDD